MIDKNNAIDVAWEDVGASQQPRRRRPRRSEPGPPQQSQGQRHPGTAPKRPHQAAAEEAAPHAPLISPSKRFNLCMAFAIYALFLTGLAAVDGLASLTKAENYAYAAALPLWFIVHVWFAE